MKATGVVRKLDDLGRIVLPKEIVKTLDIDKKHMEIFVDEETVILKKYEPGCVICKEISDTIDFKGKKVCRECIKGMQHEDNKNRDSRGFEAVSVLFKR